jgi:hypothetical protein
MKAFFEAVKELYQAHIDYCKQMLRARKEANRIIRRQRHRARVQKHIEKYMNSKKYLAFKNYIEY